MKLKNKNANICLQNEVLLRYLMRLYYISGFVYIQKTFFFFVITTKIWVKFILFWLKFRFFWLGFTKTHINPEQCPSKFILYSSYIIRTARSQNCTLMFFEFKDSSSLKKKIKIRGFSGRPVELHFALNIAKKS